MTQATTKRTGVAILLQPCLLIPNCADQYCFAGVFAVDHSWRIVQYSLVLTRSVAIPVAILRSNTATETLGLGSPNHANKF